MKKNIIILVGMFYPNTSAVGLCAKNLIAELKKQHNISVICVNNENSEKEILEVDGYNIHLITTKYLNMLNAYNHQTNRLLKSFYKIIISLWRLSMILYQPRSNYNQLINSYREELNNFDSVDIIIPFCMPMEAIIASLKYCENKNTKVLPIIYDKISASETLNKCAFLKKQNKLDKIEEYIFESSEHLFLCSSLKKYVQEKRNVFKNKITFIEHPLIINNLNCSNIQDKTLLYTGSITPGYIDIEDFLEIFKEVRNSNQFNIKIYSNLENIHFHTKLLNVKFGGWLSTEQYNLEMKQAKFLISISVKKGNQFSSKIFNIISFGKPFIHIYYDNNDVNLDYIKKYPLALLLNYNDGIKINAKKIEQWIINIQNKSINYKDIETLFQEFTPRFIYKQLNEKF